MSQEICFCRREKGNNLGICKQCGKPSCDKWFGCFVPNHNCSNREWSK